MTIKIYNTLSGEKEPLPETARGKALRLFVCGPTVYDYAHIGHARTYIFFDFFVKYLRSKGQEVFYLQNITDIDDKIIKRAAEQNKEPLELAESFTKIYLDDMKALGVDSVNEYAPATKFIPEIIDQVERLIEKGFAYKIEGDGWYFDISKDEDYGKLSNRTATQAEDAVSRIDEAVDKRNKGDFCLWKFSKPDEPVWKSKLGDGRPGWHIEDTAISEKYFGPQYDIHGGGVDLKFPHHEAEIAQQESASGKKPFVKIWMHTGFLTVNGEKMSKSLGNFITIRDFLKKNSANALRWIVFRHPYRSPIDYSVESLNEAKTNLDAMNKFLRQLDMVINAKNEDRDSLGAQEAIKEAEESIERLFSEDINTTFLLMIPFGMRTKYNAKVKAWDPKSSEKLWIMRGSEAKIVKDWIEKTLKLLGIVFEKPEIPPRVHSLVKEREEFRTNQQFIQSDALRKEIDALGFIIEDTPVGPFIWPTNPK